MCVCMQGERHYYKFVLYINSFSQGHHEVIYISFTIFSVEKIKVLKDAMKVRSCMVDKRR